MTTVSRNRPEVSIGRHHDRQRRFGGRSDDDQADAGGEREADDGAEQRLADDDLVNIEARRSDGAQRREFVQVILGAGIKRLRDDDRADDDAEQRPREQGGAGTRCRTARTRGCGCETRRASAPRLWRGLPASRLRTAADVRARGETWTRK